ncbi:MAG: HK97-gp10 family putative phage morphogenesis protein, partial [Desulfofundulus sp.]
MEGIEKVLTRLNQISFDIAADLETAAKAGARVIRDAAKDNVPVRTGTLRDSITIETVEKDEKEVVVRIGPDREGFYGCILGARTYVTTDKGTRKISSIKVGDKVLTQTGEFRTVIAVHRYSTVKGMLVVDIEVEYRRGQVHKITLTPDHKVLVFRDGRNKWVPAKDLLTSDMAYCRRKKSWNEGTARRERRICEWCGATYFKGSYTTKGAVQGERFCSPKCRIAWNASMHRGRKRGEEARARMSAAVRKRLIEHPELHPSRIVAQRGRATEAERAIAEWLNKRGLRYEKQFAIGGHYVDFFLPDQQVIIEADGAYWHQDQVKDIERDQATLSLMPEVKIIHIHFYDERFSPSLDPQPLPNVFYVVCNPGPESFV